MGQYIPGVIGDTPGIWRTVQYTEIAPAVSATRRAEIESGWLRETIWIHEVEGQLRGVYYEVVGGWLGNA